LHRDRQHEECTAPLMIEQRKNQLLMLQPLVEKGLLL
jgi:hypothetical protein